jgi:phage FluMu gp28-like protein
MTDALGPALQLLPYQRRWVEDDSPLKIVVKARQIGYSFAASIRALLECLKKKTTWVFLSKGERQSRLLMEKVQEHVQSCGILARACESAFFEGTLLKQLEVRFANGSVIYGLPANPDTARGYTGNVTLDEFAFHSDADKIYSALFPTITRGYCLEVISTPNGQQGKFYELAKAAGLVEEDSGFRIQDSGKTENRNSKLETRDDFRFSIFDFRGRPTWSGHRCDIYEAIRQGLRADLQLLHAGCDDETSWQQEYCCQFISTAENFIPPALVAQCTSAEAAKDCPPQVLASAPHPSLDLQFPAVGARHGVPLPDSEFYMGIDIGRRHDRTVFWLDEVKVSGVRFQVSGEQGSGSRFQVSGLPMPAGGLVQEPGQSQITNRKSQILTPGTLRVAVACLVRTFSNTPFAEQLAFARELLSLRRVGGPLGVPRGGQALPLPGQGEYLIRRACIDSTGMGAPLAESLEREFGPRVEPVTFTAAVKEDMAYRVKRRMEQRLDLIPEDREIARAFAAVKKLVTVAGNTRFDAERSDLGHADEFWAKALADLAAEQPSSHLSDGVIVGTPRAVAWLPAPLPALF